ncbi:MAG: hypothetical protein ACKO13_07895 [Cytophagales bacterium]
MEPAKTKAEHIAHAEQKAEADIALMASWPPHKPIGDFGVR